MSKYNGYQLKMGNLLLPIPDGEKSSVFEEGSYTFSKGKRLIEDWMDANRTVHHVVSPNDKVTISFTIKDRTQEQQEVIKPLIEKKEDIFLEYWDDINMEYKTGVFFIENIDNVSSIATKEKIYYAPLNVMLTEY